MLIDYLTFFFTTLIIKQLAIISVMFSQTIIEISFVSTGHNNHYDLGFKTLTWNVLYWNDYINKPV